MGKKRNTIPTVKIEIPFIGPGNPVRIALYVIDAEGVRHPTMIDGVATEDYPFGIRVSGPQIWMSSKIKPWGETT
jgi:hypothetical protein